jgi:hypothetical protein
MASETAEVESFALILLMLGIQGVTLHSYRYAWAERAKDGRATRNGSHRRLWGTIARRCIVSMRNGH